MKLCKECDGKREGHVTPICSSCLEMYQESHRKLMCLEGAGVDNWEGFEDAMTEFLEGGE